MSSFMLDVFSLIFSHKIFIADLTAEVRSIGKWLREVEERLRNLKITDSSSPEEVLNVYNKEKVGKCFELKSK